jgi:hypothetical protein
MYPYQGAAFHVQPGLTGTRISSTESPAGIAQRRLTMFIAPYQTLAKNVPFLYE